MALVLIDLMEGQSPASEPEPKKSSDRLPRQFVAEDFAPKTLSPEVRFADVMVWYQINDEELNTLIVATGVLTAYVTAFGFLKGNNMALVTLEGGLREQVMIFLDDLSKRKVSDILQNPLGVVPKTANEVFAQMTRVMNPGSSSTKLNASQIPGMPNSQEMDAILGDAEPAKPTDSGAFRTLKRGITDTRAVSSKALEEYMKEQERKKQEGAQ